MGAGWRRDATSNQVTGAHTCRPSLPKSSFLGSHLTEDLIQAQFAYQKTIEESIVLVYGACACTVPALCAPPPSLVVVSTLHSQTLDWLSFVPRADPIRTTAGSLSLHAYRLTPVFMAMYGAKNFSPDM